MEYNAAGEGEVPTSKSSGGNSTVHYKSFTFNVFHQVNIDSEAIRILEEKNLLLYHSFSHPHLIAREQNRPHQSQEVLIVAL